MSRVQRTISTASSAGQPRSTSAAISNASEAVDATPATTQSFSLEDGFRGLEKGPTVVHKELRPEVVLVDVMLGDPSGGTRIATPAPKIVVGVIIR